MRVQLVPGDRMSWTPCLAVIGLLLAIAPARAANVIKLDTASLVTNALNWSAVPVTTDVGEFDSTCSAGNLAALTLGGANLSLAGLQFDGTLAGPATILSGNTLTLGTSGINMENANQNVTVSCTVSPGSGSAQTWNVASGRSLTLGSAISVGSSSGTAKMTLNSGSAGTINLNGGWAENYGSDSSYLICSGGTISLAVVNMGRTASYGNTAPSAASPIAASSASGFVVNGGTVTVTGANSIGIGVGSRANSSSSMLVSSGSLTANGVVVIGKNVGSSRYNVCQVSGGTLTVTDTNTGLQLSPQYSSGVNNNAELYVSGGTANLGKISYGAAGDTAGGSGWVIVKGGSLYVGSGGVVQAAGGSYSANFSMHSGLLGAGADWVSSQIMMLSGPSETPFIIQAADGAGVSHDITLSGCLSGAGSINKTGGGKLVLAGTNTYAGSTTISAGTLQIGDGSTNGGLGVADASAITNNGTLAFKRSAGLPDPRVFRGRGALEQLGCGSLVLGGASNYAGGTTVSAGRLVVNNAGGSGTGSGAVTVQGTGLLGGTGAVSGAVSILAGGGLAPGSSVGTLTVNTLTLGAGTTNRFEFSTAPANDQVVVTNANGLVLNGGVFGLYADDGVTPWTTPGTYNLIQYSGALSGAATDGGGNLNSDWTAADAFNPHIANPQPGFSYAFGVSGGWLTLSISADASVNKGTWTAGSDGNWSASGNWTAENGTMPPRNARDSATLGESTALRTVTLDAGESLGSLLFNNANSFVIANGGYALTMDKAGTDAAISVTAGNTNQIKSAVALSDNVAVSVTSGAALYISGTVSNLVGAKTLSVSGAGTLGLSGNNSYGPSAGSVGTLLGGGGVLQVGHSGALGTGDVSVVDRYTLRPGAASLAVGNAVGISTGAVATVDSAGYTVTLNGLIGGGGALVKAGAGTLVFNSTNVYAGGTVLGGGAVSLNTTLAGNGGLGSGTVTITNNARLALYSSDGNDPGDSNASTFPNNLVVPGGAAATIWHSARGALTGSLTGSGTLNFRVNYWRGNIAGNWSSFSGQVNVVARDTDDDWRFNYGNAGMPLASVSLSNSVSFYLYNHFYDNCSFPIGTLSGAAGSVISSGSDVGGRICTYQVGARNEDSTFAGRIADSTGETALTKVGSGTRTLTGTNNTYTGATAVNVGALRVDGSLAAGSAVAVAAGARLAGTGVIGGAVTLASGNAAISQTNGVPETLTLAGGLTLNEGNVLALDVGAAADVIAMTGGAFVRNGTVTVRVNPLSGYTGRTRDLVTGIGIADATGFVLEGAPAEWKAQLAVRDGNLVLRSLVGTLVLVK